MGKSDPIILISVKSNTKQCVYLVKHIFTHNNSCEVSIMFMVLY
jgi:hypothetical protein